MRRFPRLQVDDAFSSLIRKQKGLGGSSSVMVTEGVRTPSAVGVNVS